MHPTARNLKIKIALLAAIFAATLIGVVIATRGLAPTPVGPAEMLQPHDKKTTFAAAAKTKKVYPVEKKDEIKPLLHPAIIEVSRPTTIQLGDEVPISLKIKPDRTGRTKAPFPMPGDLLTEVSSNVSGKNMVSVYETQVSDNVVARLFGGGSETAIPAHEGEEPLLVPEEGVAWNWRVPATEAGNRALEFEMVAHLQLGAAQHSWPVGTMDLNVSIVQTWLQWLEHFLGQFGTVWSWLVGLVAGISTVAAAMPLLNKWLPHRAPRQSAAAVNAADVNMVN
jgi:hypothetical protein